VKTTKLLTFPHVKDAYFREKLESGLIPYEPKLWAEAVLSARDERTLEKVSKGGK
jgi:hypothetical protein